MSDYVPQRGDRVRVTFEGVVSSEVFYGDRHAYIDVGEGKRGSVWWDKPGAWIEKLADPDPCEVTVTIGWPDGWEHVYKCDRPAGHDGTHSGNEARWTQSP